MTPKESEDDVAGMLEEIRDLENRNETLVTENLRMKEELTNWRCLGCARPRRGRMLPRTKVGNT